MYLFCHTCSVRLESEGIFWKQCLTTLCGYQSYSSCWNILASEWGRRELDGKQIRSSHLSFRCVHPSGPPGPSSLALPARCVCLMLCRASSKTSHTAESLSICYSTQRLPEDLPNTHTDIFANEHGTWQKCSRNSDTSESQSQTSIVPVTFAGVCKLQRSLSTGKASVFYRSNHLKWTPKSHFDCVVKESMAALSRIRKSNGGCFSVRLNSSGGPCAD